MVTAKQTSALSGSCRVSLTRQHSHLPFLPNGAVQWLQSITGRVTTLNLLALLSLLGDALHLSPQCLPNQRALPENNLSDAQAPLLTQTDKSAGCRLAGHLVTVFSPGQEYKRKQLEEQRQAERLQRQLQQERDYLVSLQQQQQQQRQDQRPAEKKPLYHYKEGINASEKPAWAKEVRESREDGGARVHLQGWV